jgi:Domain of unknown function (DUF4260)
MLETLPHTLLRLEGLAVGAGALALYVHGHYGWILFAALALVPDVSFFGYAAGPRVGAACYDALHTSVPPIALGAAGVLTGTDLAVQVALIWLVHIGVDRALGYGLKYPTRFQDTHLQRV